MMHLDSFKIPLLYSDAYHIQYSLHTISIFHKFANTSPLLYYFHHPPNGAVGYRHSQRPVKNANSEPSSRLSSETLLFPSASQLFTASFECIHSVVWEGVSPKMSAKKHLLKVTSNAPFPFHFNCCRCRDCWRDISLLQTNEHLECLHLFF